MLNKNKDQSNPIFALKGKHGMFHLSLGQILQCLQIADNEGAIPTIPKDWKEENIPAQFRVSYEDCPDA